MQLNLIEYLMCNWHLPDIRNMVVKQILIPHTIITIMIWMIYKLSSNSKTVWFYH